MRTELTKRDRGTTGEQAEETRRSDEEREEVGCKGFYRGGKEERAARVKMSEKKKEKEKGKSI